MRKKERKGPGTVAVAGASATAEETGGAVDWPAKQGWNANNKARTQRGRFITIAPSGPEVLDYSVSGPAVCSTTSGPGTAGRDQATALLQIYRAKMHLRFRICPLRRLVCPPR